MNAITLVLRGKKHGQVVRNGKTASNAGHVRGWRFEQKQKDETEN